jgi:hypothetical protein
MHKTPFRSVTIVSALARPVAHTGVTKKSSRLKRHCSIGCCFHCQPEHVSAIVAFLCDKITALGKAIKEMPWPRLKSEKRKPVAHPDSLLVNLGNLEHSQTSGKLNKSRMTSPVWRRSASTPALQHIQPTIQVDTRGSL